MNENRRVKDVVGYLKEVLKIKDEWPNSTLVFRGQENEEWPLKSSAERRLETSLPSQEGITEPFLEYNENLLKKCKLKNYDQREQKQLDDLELLADLQHHGAATCLIDFTRNALIALWFACEKSDEDENGKVFVVNTADEKTFLEITPTDIENKSIRDVLDFETRKIDNDQKDEPPKIRDTNKNQAKGLPTPETSATLPDKPSFWYWTPAHLNERITAQHSLFLFGLPSRGELRSEEIIIESASKEQIRRELEELHDIREESLFPDFVGFAYTQRPNAPYPTFDAKEYLRRGVEAGQRGQYSEAIASFTKAIELKPDYAEAYYLRGLAYRRQGEHEHAISNFTKAIELKPDYAEAYYLRGLAYRRQDEYEHAIEDFTKAIELKPDHADAHYDRGICFVYGIQDEYEHAIEDFTKAIELKPDHADAHYNRGFVYNGQGEYDRAIEDFTKVIELKPDHADAHYNRGLACLHLKKWQEAKSDLATAKYMGVDIVSLFEFDSYNESVADFEREFGITLPEDIAAMLTESEN